MWGAVTAPESRPAVPQVGVKLKVEISTDGQNNDNLTKGLRSLYQDEALCDVMLVAGGQAFPAHQAALASSSPALRERLREAITDAVKAEAVAAAAAEAAAAASVVAEAVKAEAAEAAAAAAAASAVPVVAETSSPEGTVAAPPPFPPALPTAPPTAPPPAPPAAPPLGAPRAAPPPLPPPAPAPAAPAVPEAEPASIPADSQCEVGAAVADAPTPQQDLQEIEKEPEPPKVLEVHFSDISSPEAIQIMLAHIYGTDGGEVANYTPSGDEANKDVLRLASQMQLPSLKEFATHWMASNLNSANAVPRIATCQEFALHDLFEAATESLAGDAFALAQVTEDLEIMKHPRLLQKLLIRVAMLYPKATKRERIVDVEEQRASKKSKTLLPAEGGA